MDVVRFADASHYTAPDHDEIVARRLQGGEASSVAFAVVGHSTFPAGSGVPLSAASIEKIYVVTQGELVFEEESGARHILRSLDSIFVPAGEARAVCNASSTAAAMIVITPRT